MNPLVRPLIATCNPELGVPRRKDVPLRIAKPVMGLGDEQTSEQPAALRQRVRESEVQASSLVPVEPGPPRALSRHRAAANAVALRHFGFPWCTLPHD